MINGKFEPGDKVRIVQKISSNGQYESVKIGMICIVQNHDNSPTLNVSLKGDYCGWLNHKELELINDSIEVKKDDNNNMKDLLTKFKNAIMDEPRKTLIKYGVETDERQIKLSTVYCIAFFYRM